MIHSYYKSEIPPTNVFLAGAGVVENSWLPVRKALETYFLNLPEGEENLAFATEIYELRRVATAYKIIFRLAALKHLKSVLQLYSKFKQSMRRYNNLKKEIADNLIFAMNENQLNLIDSIPKIHAKWLKNPDTDIIVTTNWDLMLESFFTDYFVYHLHGDIMDYETLYLPSEIAAELYHYIEGKRKLSSFMNRISYGDWLATGIERLIISGLSLSPLDAELHSFLNSAIQKGSIPEVIIIDPYPEQVYKKLQFHTRNWISKINMLKPADL